MCVEWKWYKLPSWFRCPYTEMPFQFLFCGGRRKQTNNETKLHLEEEDALSAVGDMEEDMVFYEEQLNEVYFMNPGFDAAGRYTPSPSPAPSMKLAHRQMTRRMSSRVREYRRVPSVDASEIDIDVVLAPSAFAFQNVPSGLRDNSFCSRDDSEIVTKTALASPEPSGRGFCGLSSPHINPMFLHGMSSRDDSEVGSCTLDKRIPLRHMGSALSYRVSVSGTPDASVYDDGDCSPPLGRGHSRRYSDMSDRLSSFKERNKMVRLESLVGAVEKPDRSVFEFGILNPSSLQQLCPEQPTPRLFRSNSDRSAPIAATLTPLSAENSSAEVKVSVDCDRISSFPISLLSEIVEEDDDLLEFVEAEEEDAKTVSSLSSISQANNGALIRSSFKLRVPPLDLTKDSGFTNPAFEEPAAPRAAPPTRATVSRRMSKKRSSKRIPKMDDSYFATAARNKKHTRDESLHTALMERYLLQSVVNKYLIE